MKPTLAAAGSSDPGRLVLFGPEEQRAPEMWLETGDGHTLSLQQRFTNTAGGRSSCLPGNRTAGGGTSSSSTSSSVSWRAGAPPWRRRHRGRTARTPGSSAGSFWRPAGPWGGVWAGWRPEEPGSSGAAALAGGDTSSQTGSPSRTSLSGGFPCWAVSPQQPWLPEEKHGFC